MYALLFSGSKTYGSTYIMYMTFNNFPIIPLTFSQHTLPSWWYLVRDVEDQTSNNRHLGERQAESKRL